MLEELEKTLVLLAFDDPSRSPFSDLMSELHRQKVIKDPYYGLRIFNNELKIS